MCTPQQDVKLATSSDIISVLLVELANKFFPIDSGKYSNMAETKRSQTNVDKVVGVAV